MTHNDVARRTAPQMPARTLTPRALACDGGPESGPGQGLRGLTRELPSRTLVRTSEGGR